MPSQVLFELAIHDVGREQQGTLAELGGLRRFDGRARSGRRIDDDNFVGMVDEILRDRLRLGPAEDAAHEFLLLGDVLDIDRCENRDPRLEQFLDIFVTLSMPAPRGVVVRQPVDKADLRVTCDDRGHIDDRHASNVQCGNALEGSNHLSNVRRRIGLCGGHHDVLASFVPAPALVEQPERFSNPRGVTQEDLQRSPAFRPLCRLDLPEQRFRVAVSSPTVVINTHGRAIPERAIPESRIVPDENRAAASCDLD